VANAVGRLKGKAAIRMHREYLGRTRNFTGLHFWARGYCVSPVGFDEAVIRQDIRNHEEQEKRAAQLALGDFAPRREGKHTHGAGPGSPSAPCGGLLQQCPLRGQTITVPSEEGFLQQCPLRGQTHNSAPLQGGILKPPALRVVVD
jgi:putative transposase